MGTKRRGIGELGFLVLLVIVIAIIGLVFDYLHVATYAGREYDVTVKVANVERSEHLYDHTNVWIDQYIASKEGGREALKYELLGHHELMPGKIYRIVFRDKIMFNIWRGLFFVAGRVISIEEIG